jgi:hypothetical protein
VEHIAYPASEPPSRRPPVSCGDMRRVQSPMERAVPLCVLGSGGRVRSLPEARTRGQCPRTTPASTPTFWESLTFVQPRASDVADCERPAIGRPRNGLLWTIESLIARALRIVSDTRRLKGQRWRFLHLIDVHGWHPGTDHGIRCQPPLRHSARNATVGSILVAARAGQ